MRDAVPACGTAGGAEQVRDAGTAPPPEPSGSRVLTTRAGRTTPDDRTADPVAPDSPQHARRRLEQTITTGPVPQRPRRSLASHPRNSLIHPLTTLRTRRARPNGPPPQPSRSTSSKPLPNNLRDRVGMGDSAGVRRPLLSDGPFPCPRQHTDNPERWPTGRRSRQSPGVDEPFSSESMAQGSGSARWCGKDGCGVGVARTGVAHLSLPRTFPRYHADPGQSEGLPGEKGSM